MHQLLHDTILDKNITQTWPSKLCLRILTCCDGSDLNASGLAEAHLLFVHGVRRGEIEKLDFPFLSLTKNYCIVLKICFAQ